MGDHVYKNLGSSLIYNVPYYLEVKQLYSWHLSVGLVALPPETFYYPNFFSSPQYNCISTFFVLYYFIL